MATPVNARLHILRERGIPVLGKPLSLDFLSLVAKAVGEEKDLLGVYIARSKLSNREAETLLAGVAGLSETETAIRMHCAVSTVKTFWQRIFRKTGCNSKAEVLAAVTRFVSKAREKA